ncbi:MAG: HD domain-containing protein [Cyanobacteria bacterium RUI128]|nr:HD domain-containing protein [Cyanobacteria bacterium RUI128]
MINQVYVALAPKGVSRDAVAKLDDTTLQEILGKITTGEELEDIIGYVIEKAPDLAEPETLQKNREIREENGDTIIDEKNGDELAQRTIIHQDGDNIIETVIVYQNGKPSSKTVKKNGNTQETHTYEEVSSEYLTDEEIDEGKTMVKISTDRSKSDGSKVTTYAMSVDENGNYSDEDFRERVTTTLSGKIEKVFISKDGNLSKIEYDNNSRTTTKYNSANISEFDNGTIEEVSHHTADRKQDPRYKTNNPDEQVFITVDKLKESLPQVLPKTFLREKNHRDIYEMFAQGTSNGQLDEPEMAQLLKYIENVVDTGRDGNITERDLQAISVSLQKQGIKDADFKGFLDAVLNIDFSTMKTMLTPDGHIESSYVEDYDGNYMHTYFYPDGEVQAIRYSELHTKHTQNPGFMNFKFNKHVVIPTLREAIVTNDGRNLRKNVDVMPFDVKYARSYRYCLESQDAAALHYYQVHNNVLDVTANHTLNVWECFGNMAVEACSALSGTESINDMHNTSVDGVRSANELMASGNGIMETSIYEAGRSAYTGYTDTQKELRINAFDALFNKKFNKDFKYDSADSMIRIYDAYNSVVSLNDKIGDISDLLSIDKKTDKDVGDWFKFVKEDDIKRLQSFGVDIKTCEQIDIPTYASNRCHAIYYNKRSTNIKRNDNLKARYMLMACDILGQGHPLLEEIISKHQYNDENWWKQFLTNLKNNLQSQVSEIMAQYSYKNTTYTEDRAKTFETQMYDLYKSRFVEVYGENPPDMTHLNNMLIGRSIISETAEMAVVIAVTRGIGGGISSSMAEGITAANEGRNASGAARMYQYVAEKYGPKAAQRLANNITKISGTAAMPVVSYVSAATDKERQAIIDNAPTTMAFGLFGSYVSGPFGDGVKDIISKKGTGYAANFLNASLSKGAGFTAEISLDTVFQAMTGDDIISALMENGQGEAIARFMNMIAGGRVNASAKQLRQQNKALMNQFKNMKFSVQIETEGGVKKYKVIENGEEIYSTTNPEEIVQGMMAKGLTEVMREQVAATSRDLRAADDLSARVLTEKDIKHLRKQHDSLVIRDDGSVTIWDSEKGSVCIGKVDPDTATKINNPTIEVFMEKAQHDRSNHTIITDAEGNRLVVTTDDSGQKYNIIVYDKNGKFVESKQNLSETDLKSQYENFYKDGVQTEIIKDGEKVQSALETSEDVDVKKRIDTLISNLTNDGKMSQLELKLIGKELNDKNISFAEKIYKDFPKETNLLLFTLLRCNSEEKILLAEALYDMPHINKFGIHNYLHSLKDICTKENLDTIQNICANADISRENLGYIIESLNKHNLSFAEKLCADKDFPKEFAASVLSRVNEENMSLAEQLCADKNFPKNTIFQILENTNKVNLSFAEKLCADKDFPREVIWAILKTTNEENLAFAEKLCADKDFSRNYIPSILASTNNQNRMLAEKLCADKDFPTRDISAILRVLNEENMAFAEKLCADEDFPKIDIPEILRVLNKENMAFAEKLCADKDFPKDDIPGILQVLNKENMAFAEKLCADKDFPKEYVSMIIGQVGERNIAVAEKLCYSKDIDKSKIYNLLCFYNKYDRLNISSLSLAEKINHLDILSRIDEKTKNILKTCDIDIDYFISQFKTQLGAHRPHITVSKDQQQKFGTFLANNNSKAEEVFRTFDFSQYGTKGLPLKYSREDFNIKVNDLLKDLPENERRVILNHFGLVPGTVIGNNNYGFEGLPNNKPFENTEVSETARQIAERVREEIEIFTSKNEVMTGNAEVDAVLTDLIQGLPEFTSIIQKEQHGTHAGSVDIHTLNVLQSAMNHPLYQTLSDKDKTILKISALVHDLGKKAGVTDPGHQSLSSEYAVAILDKFPFPQEMKDRIIDIVENHHWFEQYNKGKISAEDVAVRCRRPEDLKIYEILSKADFENVNPTFHYQYSEGARTPEEFDAFMTRKMQAIEHAVTKIYERSNLVFDTKFVRNGEFFPRKTVMIGGTASELKVLDFNEITADQTVEIERNNRRITVPILEAYGFAPGTTKDNARFIIHMTDMNGLANVKSLTQNSLNQSAWSTTLTLASGGKTYGGRDFGFVFDVDQANISEAYHSNTASGYQKGLERFEAILFNKVYDNYSNNMFADGVSRLRDDGINLSDSEIAQLRGIIEGNYLTRLEENITVGDRTFTPQQLENYFGRDTRLYVRNQILTHLQEKGYELSESDYAELSRQLVTKKYTTQIRQDITINGKTIKAQDLVDVLEQSRDDLVFTYQDNHSEIVPINPRIMGLVAKVNSIDECPAEFLKFARDNDYPIIILGGR